MHEADQGPNEALPSSGYSGHNPEARISLLIAWPQSIPVQFFRSLDRKLFEHAYLIAFQINNGASKQFAAEGHMETRGEEIDTFLEKSMIEAMKVIEALLENSAFWKTKMMLILKLWAAQIPTSANKSSDFFSLLMAKPTWTCASESAQSHEWAVHVQHASTSDIGSTLVQA